MKKSIIEEVSAGGVVYRKVGDTCEFLIGKHSGYHKWVLPKGLVEPGESYPETAEREVMEEVGTKARVVKTDPIMSVEYTYQADLKEVRNKNPHTEETVRRVIRYQEDGGGKVLIHKKVVFFLMEVEADSGEHGWEMEERKWVGYEEGLTLLAFESEKEVFERAGKELI